MSVTAEQLHAPDRCRLAKFVHLCVTIISDQVDWMLATELLIDLFFMCDIVLNFNTGYIIEQAGGRGSGCTCPVYTSWSATSTSSRHVWCGAAGGEKRLSTAMHVPLHACIRSGP